MKKSSLIGIVVGVIIAIALWKNSSYWRCSNHMLKISNTICEFRHETGRWPYTEKEILENEEILDGVEFKTLYGKPIAYDPGEPGLFSDCPHGKTSAHGFDLGARYEDIYK